MNKYLLFTLMASLFLFACATEVEENIELLNTTGLEAYNEIEYFDDLSNNSNTDTLLALKQNVTSKKNIDISYSLERNVLEKTSSKAIVKSIKTTKLQSESISEITALNLSDKESLLADSYLNAYDVLNKNKKDEIEDLIYKNDSSLVYQKRKTINTQRLTKPKKLSNNIRRAYKIDTVFLDEVKISNTIYKANTNFISPTIERNVNKENKKSSIPKSGTSYENSFSDSTRVFQKEVEKSRNDKVKESLKTKVSNNEEVTGQYGQTNLVSKINNEGYNKRDNPRFRTDFEEVKVTPLFTSAKAHNKKYKKEKPLQSRLNKGGIKNSISSTFIKAEQKPKVVTTTYIKEKKPLNKVSNSNIELTQPKIKSKDYRYYNNKFGVKLMRKQNAYETGKKHTLLLEVINLGDYIEPINLEVDGPEDWKIISISALESLDTNEKKLCLVSFYIPTQSKPGNAHTTFVLKTNNYIIQSFDFDLNIADNYDLEVFNISAPQQLEAGETIEVFYGIRNNGNVQQDLNLTSRNTIDGTSNIVIPKDSTVIVKITQKTNPKSNVFKKLGTNLDVFSSGSGKMYYTSKSVEIIPSKIAQKDPFLRFPVRASLYYSSYTNEYNHYSTMSAELKGAGFLDEARENYLNFTIRAPKKENLRRFSIIDQYSLIYKYKNKATLYLGDHSYFMNNLGFGSRYGMGFKLDYNINKWRLSTFYTKPRLYNYRSKALYGFRADYFISDTQNVGITLEKSQGNVFSYRNLFNEQGKGQILTVDYDYEDENTFIEAELSTSFNAKSADYAANFNFNQNIQNFRYNNYILYAGKNYLGNISNSLQLTNSLYYYKEKFNIGVGHSFSQVNRRLDPELFETEPYFENYFASMGYRFSGKHYLNFRFDKRVREDQLEPKNYHYEDYGFNYNFIYTDKLFTGSFGGRFAKSKNLLTESDVYRNTYSHFLNVSYKLFKGFNLRGGLNHIYTNRYGFSDEGINFVRYNFGFNYKINKWLRVNSNFNSGFSPEENYKQRDYINFNLIAQANNRHRFEARANYFERPGVINNKELYAYGKYTYTFGVPVKRILDQGGVEGAIFTNNSDINIKGIKLYSAGKTIVTDRYGNFEFNNLPIGTNYIFIDDSSLPLNVVSKMKNPIEVVIESDRKIELGLELMQAGSLYGHLNLNNLNRAINTNLESYVKLENKDFTFYTESDEEGKFKFQNIVPGSYTFTVMRFKKNDKYFKLVKEQNVIISEAIDTQLKIDVTGKERKIKFKINNLKVGYND